MPFFPFFVLAGQPSPPFFWRRHMKEDYEPAHKSFLNHKKSRTGFSAWSARVIESARLQHEKFLQLRRSQQRRVRKNFGECCL